MPPSKICQEFSLTYAPGFLLFDLSISTFLLILLTTSLTLFITSITRVQQRAHERLQLLTAISETLERFLPHAQQEGVVQELITPHGTIRLVCQQSRPNFPYFQVYATGTKGALVVSIRTGYTL